MKCYNCKRHLQVSEAYTRHIVCQRCGARLRVVNTNWLIFINIIMLIGVPVLGYHIDNIYLFGFTMALMAGLLYLFCDQWLLRTEPRVDHIDITAQ